MPNATNSQPTLFYETTLGNMVLGDWLVVLHDTASQSVDLIMTSPPFGLVRK